MYFKMKSTRRTKLGTLRRGLTYKIEDIPRNKEMIDGLTKGKNPASEVVKSAKLDKDAATPISLSPNTELLKPKTKKEQALVADLTVALKASEKYVDVVIGERDVIQIAHDVSIEARDTAVEALKGVENAVEKQSVAHQTSIEALTKEHGVVVDGLSAALDTAKTALEVSVDEKEKLVKGNNTKDAKIVEQQNQLDVLTAPDKSV